MAINIETSEGLRKEIEQLRSKQPTLNSHEIWEHLVKNSDRQKPLEEIMVETCLVAHFDYPEEETIKRKARKADLEYLESDNKRLMERLQTKNANTKPILPVTKDTRPDSEETQLGAKDTELDSRDTKTDIDEWVSDYENTVLEILEALDPKLSYGHLHHKSLFRRIHKLRLVQPNLNSRQIWRRLNEDPESQNSVDEVVVEAWLIVGFNYPMEETIQVKAYKNLVRKCAQAQDRIVKDPDFNMFVKNWYQYLESNPKFKRRIEDLDLEILRRIHDLWFHQPHSSSRWIWGELNKKPNELMPLKEIVVEACLVSNGYPLENTIQLKNQKKQWWQENELLRYGSKNVTLLDLEPGEAIESRAPIKNKLNLKKVVQDIKELRHSQPTLSPRQIWIALDKENYWPAPLLEIAVEACLVKFCGVRPEDTAQLETIDDSEVAGKRFLHRILDYFFGSHKLENVGCKCCGHAKIVEHSEIEHYRNGGRIKVDPKTTRAVGLLRIMLDTKHTIKSFLPINTPTALAIMPYREMNSSQRVYALFYAEWDAWMGPLRRTPPPIDYVAGAEMKAIIDSESHLDCYDEIQTWTPESPASFETHVQCALISSCWAYRGSIDWLMFVIKRTEDPDTIKMVNSIAAGFYGLKIYHMGNGFVEYHNWHNDWFYSFRVSHGIVAFVKEKEDSPEVMWADRDEGGGYTAHYRPVLLPLGTSTPVLKARDKEGPDDWNYGTFEHGQWACSVKKV
ncbi:hypothetical protein ACHAO1_007771 [Botrytis cinerea]